MIRLLVFLGLKQDEALLAPVIAAAKADARFQVTVRRHGRFRPLPCLKGFDALLCGAESNVRAHKAAHRLAWRANARGVETFTLQHGFENIGLTYWDDYYGAVDFAAKHILTWGDPGALPAWLPENVRARCVEVGFPRSAPPPGLPPLEGGGDLLIAGNLHWHRYSGEYRTRFAQDAKALCAAFPERRFYVKPHPVSTGEHVAALCALPNVRQVRNEDWTRLGLAGVITTPSTLALDAAWAGLPVAVAGYGLGLSAYAPLPVLQNTEDWVAFARAPDGETARRFVERNVRKGGAEGVLGVILGAAEQRPGIQER